jgi:hypothetical protein
MPAQRPRAAFEPVAPDFDIYGLIESTPNFSFVDRISVDQIDEQGVAAFEKLVLLHVIIGGKPLVVDGFENRLDPWTFSPKWLNDNVGSKSRSNHVCFNSFLTDAHPSRKFKEPFNQRVTTPHYWPLYQEHE